MSVLVKLTENGMHEVFRNEKKEKQLQKTKVERLI